MPFGPFEFKENSLDGPGDEEEEEEGEEDNLEEPTDNHQAYVATMESKINYTEIKTRSGMRKAMETIKGSVSWLYERHKNVVMSLSQFARGVWVMGAISKALDLIKARDVEPKS